MARRGRNGTFLRRKPRSAHSGDRHRPKHCQTMFRLIITVRRGSACNLEGAATTYALIDAARLGAAALFRNERVQRVVIARDDLPPSFVEWLER